MEAGGAVAVEREPAEQGDAGDRVVRDDDRGPRQVVVHEPLAKEATEEPLHQPMLEVKVHVLVV